MHVYNDSAESGNCGRNGDVRLSGGGVPSEGAVQVCLNGTWARVCAEVWTEEAAKVVCTQFSSRQDGVREGNLKLS